MTADELRRAAAKVRELATSVTGGVWEAGERCVWAESRSPSVYYVIVSDGQDGDGGCVDTETAAYIAAMHPAVGLAVADWLDDEARFDDAARENGGRGWGEAAPCVTVARAILGESA